MRLMAKETEKENIASKVFESKSEKEAGFEPEFENEENVEPNFDVFEPKTEEELEEEIRLELKQRMQKYDDLPTKEIQTTPSKKIKVSSLFRYFIFKSQILNKNKKKVKKFKF